MSESEATLQELLAHAGWLRGLARRLVGESGADDLVQEVWLRAADRPPTHTESPRGWLKSVLRSVHVRQVQRREAARSRERRVAEPEALPSTADLVGRAEAQRVLVEAVLGLDEPYRKSLLLHHFEGLPAAEIARRSGEPASTVRNRIARAVERLRTRLDERPGGRESWISGMALLATPETGAAGLTALALGTLAMWKTAAAAAILVVASLLGSRLLLADPEPSSVPGAVPRAAGAEADEVALRPSTLPPSGSGRKRIAAAPAGSAPYKAPGGAPDGHVLVGEVAGPDGAAIEGAEVRLSDGLGGAQAVTDALGRFRFELTAEIPAAVDLSVSALGHVSTRTSVGPQANPAKERHELGRILLDRAVRLRGTVIDADGRPVPGAELRLEATDAPRFDLDLADAEGPPDGTTGAGGAFTLDKAPVGPWRLRVDHPDHPTTIESGETRAAGVGAPSIEIELLRGGAVAGLAEGTIEADLFVVARRTADGVDPNRSRRAPLLPDGTFELRGLLAEETYELAVAGAADLRATGAARSNRVVARTGDRGVRLVLGAGVVPTSGAGLRFRAVDARTGAPIPRYETFHRDGSQGGLRSLTRGAVDAPDGRSEFAGLSARDARGGAALRIAAEGYAFFEMGGIALESGRFTDLGDVGLRPVPILPLTFVDDATGAPIEGVEVSLDGFPSRELAPAGLRSSRCVECHGNTRGSRAEPTSLGPGSCYPDYQHRVFMSSTWRAASDATGAAAVPIGSDVRMAATITHPDYVDLALERTVYTPEMGRTIRLSRGGGATITVLESNGRPTAGLTVTMDGGTSRTTDARGVARFESVAAGVHEFVAGRRPAAPTPVFVGAPGQTPPAGPAGERLRVLDGEESRLTIRLEAANVLLGRITERGAPLAGATLALTPVGRSGAQVISFGGPPSAGTATTRSDGSFAMEDLDLGEHVLTVRHPGRAMADRIRVNLQPGENLADLDLAVAIVEGVVLDARGEPVARASVSVDDPQGPGGGSSVSTMIRTMNPDGTIAAQSSGKRTPTVRTDREGRFTLRGVTPGQDLAIRASTRDGTSGGVRVRALDEDETRTGITIEIDPRGALRFEVATAGRLTEAFPVARLTRLADGAPEGEPRTVQGNMGSGTVSDLAPGRYRVEGRLRSGEWTEPIDVEIVAGRTARVTLGP